MSARLVRRVVRGAMCAVALLGFTVSPGAGSDCVPTWSNLNYVGLEEEGPEHLLDIYLPAEGEGPFPVAIYIYGSAWSSNNGKASGLIAASLLGPEGVATVAINHRGTVTNPGAVFPAQIHDVKAAVRYVRATAAEHNLDPDRIMVFGGSSGGHLAALLGTSGGVGDFTVENVTMNLEGDPGPYGETSSSVVAVCEAAGPVNFLTLNSCPEMPSYADHDAPNSPASRLIGGPVQDHPDECALANPVTYIDPEDPPFAIFHGDSDGQVPWCQSRELYEALCTAGVPAEFHLMPDVGHNMVASQETVDRIVVFITKVLRPTRVWQVERVDALPAAPRSVPQELTAAGELLFFTADDGSNGRALWATDGELGAARIVKSFGTPGRARGPEDLTAVGHRVFFSAVDEHGRELWVSDGTGTGTHLVKDIRPGSLGSSPSDMAALDGLLLFCAEDGANGRELWKSDGTSEGTAMVADLRALGGSQPANLYAFDDLLFFSARGNGGGCELWSSDGTAAGSRLVADMRTGGPGSSPAEFAAVGDLLFFGANDGKRGRELWVIDRATAGARLVRDISPGSRGSNPCDLTAAGSRVFFQASTPASGVELWASDGTESGTYLVKHIAPSGRSAYPRQLTAARDRLFFIVDDITDTVWTSDGTEEGTVPVHETGMTYPTKTSPGWELAVIGGTVLFSSWGDSGLEIWRADGTCWGTLAIARIPFAVPIAGPFWLAAAGDRAFLSISGPTSAELWRITRDTSESP